MMHGHEKSDPAIVAVKPANKAERSAAELVEPRAGTKGNADQQSTRLDSEPGERVTGAGTHTENFCRHTPEVGAVCGKAASTDLCGGRSVMSVPTATASYQRPSTCFEKPNIGGGQRLAYSETRMSKRRPV